MKGSNFNNRFLVGVIEGYRKTLASRYQYDSLIKLYDLPPSFTPVKVAEFREYFLEYIYPSIDKRTELNDAFGNLDNYTKEPKRLLSLMKDSSSLFIKFGVHLPKIFNAGIRALRSFRTGTRFENRLTRQARASGTEPPYSTENIHGFIKTLPKEEIDKFIVDGRALFEVMYDRKLVAKIKEVLAALIIKMKAKPETYGASEIRGIEIGREIIVKGDAIFDELSEEDQKLIIKMVIEIESGILDLLFES